MLSRDKEHDYVILILDRDNGVVSIGTFHLGEDPTVLPYHALVGIVVDFVTQSCDNNSTVNLLEKDMPLYTLRDENGVMKARFDDETAGRITLSIDGKWKPYKTKERMGRCFEITTDSLMMVENHITLYLWKGDKLVEENS